MDFDVGPERCAGCSKIVFPPEKLVALKKTWHKWCLKCTTCKVTLSIKSLESWANEPYCRSHMQSAKLGGGTKTMHVPTGSELVTKDTKVQGTDQSTENAPSGAHIVIEKQESDQSTENAPVRSNITYEKHDGDQSNENAPSQSNITYETHHGDQSTENEAQASGITYEQHHGDQSTESEARPSGITYEQHHGDQSTESEAQSSGITYDEPAADQSTQAGGEEAAAEGTETVALYDFDGTEGGEQELTFKEGARLWVTDTSDPDGYYYGYDENNVEGYFPGTYCQLGAEE